MRTRAASLSHSRDRVTGILCLSPERLLEDNWRIAVRQLKFIDPIVGTNVIGTVQVCIELLARLERCQSVVVLASCYLPRTVKRS